MIYLLGDLRFDRPKMATWQFDLHCVPRQAVMGRFGQLPIALSRSEVLNADTFWQGAPTPPKLTETLDDILSRTSSWHNKIQNWGEEQGNRISLMKNQTSINSIWVRIDVRSIDYEFLLTIVELAKSFDWVFLTNDNYVIPPRVTKLLQMIRKSDAFRFVVDPDDFLKKIGNYSKEDLD